MKLKFKIITSHLKFIYILSPFLVGVYHMEEPHGHVFEFVSPLGYVGRCELTAVHERWSDVHEQACGYSAREVSINTEQHRWQFAFVAHDFVNFVHKKLDLQ